MACRGDNNSLFVFKLVVEEEVTEGVDDDDAIELELTEEHGYKPHCVFGLVVVLVVLKVELRKTPSPTMIIIAITMRAEIPNEIALFAFPNVRQTM